MKLMRITIMFSIIGVLLLVVTTYLSQRNPVGVKLTPLSENEMSSLIGADGFMQACPSGGPHHSCTGRASCIGVTCVTLVLNGFPVGCRTDGGSNGCTGSGSWKDCHWALCLWCDEDGTARCGNFEYHACDTVLGGLGCTGTCSTWSITADCKNDCT